MVDNIKEDAEQALSPNKSVSNLRVFFFGEKTTLETVNRFFWEENFGELDRGQKVGDYDIDDGHDHLFGYDYIMKEGMQLSDVLEYLQKAPSVCFVVLCPECNGSNYDKLDVLYCKEGYDLDFAVEHQYGADVSICRATLENLTFG